MSFWPVKAGLKKPTCFRIPNVHAHRLMTPISVFGALMTPPCPLQITPSPFVINAPNLTIPLTEPPLFRWIGIIERLMVAGFGNVPTPISLIAHTSLGFFPISTPYGLVFSMTVKPTSPPSRISQQLHILIMLANLALELQPGASLHTLSLRIP